MLSILCFLSIGSTSIAQPVLAWDKGYGGENYDDCNAAIQTADLGYLLGGVTSSDPSGDITQPSRDDLSIPWWFQHVRGDFWVLRTDDNGDKLWQARFGGNKEDRLWAVEETDDGGFMLGGVSYSDSTGDRTTPSRGDGDYWIIKTDALGNKEWDRAYGGDSTDILNVLLQTQDGGYMLGGWSISSGWSPADSTGEKSDTLRGLYDWWVVKIDALGEVEWEQSYGGDGDEQLADIVQKPDGTYVIAGGSESSISGDVDSMQVGERDMWVLHIANDGTKINEFRYGSVDEDDLNRIILTRDGGYLLGGSSYAEFPSGDKTDPGFGDVFDFDWWVLKVDALGAIEWQHTFGGSNIENLYSLSQNTIDHYLLGGFTRSVDGTLADNSLNGGGDYWVMYLDPNGNILWDEVYGGDAAESLEQLFQTDDGGYLMAGHSISDVSGDKEDPSNGFNDFWIVKTLCNINVELTDTIVCPGDEVIISALDANCAGCTYSWSDNSNITDSIRLVTTQENVTYGVTLTDGVGCVRSDEINITVYTPPTVELGNDVLICVGDTHTIDAANTGLDFAWNTTEVSQTIAVNYPGKYVVSVTDAIGCTTPDSINLLVSDLQAYVLTTNTSCGEDNGTATIIASGGTGNYDYTWAFNGSNNATVNNLATGEYVVIVTDGTCSIEVKGIVGFEEAPTINWEQNYGGSDTETLNDIKQTSDGGYIVVGGSRSSDVDLNVNAGEMDLWVKKLNASGGIEWQQSYGGSLYDEGHSIAIDETGGYIITGVTASNDGDINTNNGERDVWVLRIDDFGTVIWSQTYGGPFDDEGTIIQQTWEGGYIFGANTFSNTGDIGNPIGGMDVWLVKLDVNGQIEWENSYGGVSDEKIADLEQTIDGGYFIGAQSLSNVPANNGLLDYYIFKVDSRGEAQWRNNLGGSGDDRLRDFTPTNDGGFLLLGTSGSNDIDVSGNNGVLDMWLAKVNNAGALQWQKTIGGSMSDAGLSINPTGDGNFIVSGNSLSADDDIAGNHGLIDLVLLKIDENGNPIWSQHYGTSLVDLGGISLQTSDGGFILAGETSGLDIDASGNHGGWDNWLIKLNAPPLPTVTLPADQTTCALDTVTFSPVINNCLGCTWQWDDLSMDSTRIETPAISTTYEIVVTDIYGCTSSDEIMINVNPLPMLDLGNDFGLCEGASIDLDAGTDGIVYNWSTSQVSQMISIDTAGTYAVTVTDANTCSAQDSVAVVINALPEVDLGVDTAFCAGDTYTIDAGNPGASYEWSFNGAISQTITVSDLNTYSVTVTDNNNCTGTDEVLVSFDAAPQPVNLDLLDPGPFCPGTVFDITIQNSQMGVEYTLFDGTTISGGSNTGNGGIITVMTDPIYNTTTFNVVATLSGMCADTLTASTVATIGDNEAPIISCRADTSIIIEDGNCTPILSVGAATSFSDNCGVETVTYALTGDTNINSPSTGINDASDETFNVGLTTVIYTAIDSFGNQAFCSFNVEVIDMTEPLAGTPAMDMIVECDGAGNAMAFDNWLANHAGATAFDACSDLIWSTIPANPMLSDGCGETGMVEVTFMASDTSGNAVTSIATFTIQDTQAPSFTVPADITIGAGDDATDLTLTGDVIDEADNCDGGVSDQGPRVATYVDVISIDNCADVITRTWTLTDECGNTTTQDQIISQEFTPPSGSLSGAVAICSGEPVDITFNLNGSSGIFNVVYTDDVSNQMIDLSNITDGHVLQVNPTETTTYSIVSVIDLSRVDCEGTIGTDVLVTIHETPQIIDITETCNLLNTTYVVTFEITGGLAGTYTVSGGAGTLNGSTFTSAAIDKDIPYSFFIEDGNGCGPIEISGVHDCQCVTEAGTIQETNLSVCGTETLTATLIGSNLDGNDLIEFIVHDGDVNTIGPNIFYTSNAPDFTFQPGTGMQYGITYFVTVIAGTDDGNGNVTTVDACYSESLGVPIVFHEPPTAVITPSTGTELDCTNTSLHLTGNDSQTQGGIAYQWSVDGAGNIASGTTMDLAIVDEVGNYILMVTDQATTCTATATIEITIDINAPQAVIAEPALLTCDDQMVSLDATASTTGTNFTYEWLGGTIESGEEGLNPIVSQSANYTLIVTDTTNGCTDEAQQFVDTNYAAPIVNAGLAPQLDCIQTEVTLDGAYDATTSNISIQWVANPGNIISGGNTLTPTVDEGGIYTLIVTNEDTGCPGESTMQVTVDPSRPQSAAMESVDPACFGDENGSISILNVDGGTGPYTYSIDGSEFYSINEFDNLAAGEYNVVIQDAIGCEWDTLIYLETPPELIVELGDNSIQIELGDSVRLNAFVNQAIDTFIWNIESLTTMSPYVRPTDQTSYQIQVINADGCIDEDFVTITVRKDRNVYIPTAFSPNDDGINDFFSIYSDQSVVNIKTFRVFDRWGETIFAVDNIPTNAESEGWDGTFKGEDMQQGVFVYFAEIEFFDGRVEIFKGDVTLLK